MGNIKNFNFNKLDLKLSNSDYWDFYLANDSQDEINYGGLDSNGCLAVWYDFNDPLIYQNSIGIETIVSLAAWDGAVNSGYTFPTFGLTGLDNGKLRYVKSFGDESNIGLLDILNTTNLTIPANDFRLKLNLVSGSTNQFVYPIELVNDTTPIGTRLRLSGGFYQGFYKIDGSTYEVLPTRTKKAWVADFWLNKTEISHTGTTLNDLYPNNKGFFFYMGTRAENKFWNIFDGNNTGCTINCTSDTGCTDTITNFCTTIKETTIDILDEPSSIMVPLSPPQIKIEKITNQFLIYGRADDNYKCNKCGSGRDNRPFGRETVCSYSGGGIFVSSLETKKTDYTNPFLVYGRAKDNQTCTGCGNRTSDGYGRETVCSYSGDSEPKYEVDKDVDIIDNAVGFRIKDDGSIGYRSLKLTGQCSDDIYVTGVTIDEHYSPAGIVKDDEWSKISIRFVANETYTEQELICKNRRKGRLMIYVNCRLKVVFDNFEEFIAKRLDEYYAKQIGVPFNLSIGGGSQGLLENMTFDGQDINDLGLNIERNFAGTFIGEISEFKFNICDITFNDIDISCKVDGGKYGLPSNR
jgi:ribosomal protein S27E